MTVVSKRDLNQNTAGVLDRVTATQDVVVTERGTPRWRVTRYTDQDDTLGRLAREGRYTPPSATPTPWPDQAGGPRYTTSDVDALLDDMRGDH